MARYFAGRGWRVCGCARDGARAAEVEAGLGEPHRCAAVDVGEAAAVALWAERVLAEAGAPDLLINNAAVMHRPAPLWELSAAETEAVLRANVLGTFNVLRSFVPAMAARGSGVIVNFSSGWGRSTSPEVSAYCASKWAVEGLTSALAQELPPGLAAVALNPGIIATEMLRTCWAEGAEAYPPPEEWIRAAGPFLERLGARDNGRSLSVPGAALE
jgi:NAD(P)-dependent dehydrogenase (short-subunit alcohol dehydrogenase family)